MVRLRYYKLVHGEKPPDVLRKELDTLVADSESKIDFSDIPATLETDWLNSERGRFFPDNFNRGESDA